jgi:hypothetical protein
VFTRVYVQLSVVSECLTTSATSVRSLGEFGVEMVVQIVLTPEGPLAHFTPMFALLIVQQVLVFALHRGFVLAKIGFLLLEAQEKLRFRIENVFAFFFDHYGIQGQRFL